MKKTILLFACTSIFGMFAHDAIAASCTVVACSEATGSSASNMASPFCTSGTTTCYQYTSSKHIIVSDCTGCMDGYQLNPASFNSDCGLLLYNTCEKKCAECSNCTSDTSWSSAGNGVEKKVLRLCDCGTCTETTSYRCAAGYYGSDSDCTACPSPGTSSAGTTDISGCCIGTGISLTDERGMYEYSSQCCAS